MDDSIEYDESESGRNPLRERMKQLESENAAWKQKAEQAAEAQRKLAFLEAGVDPNLPIAKYFMKGYDGELNAESIRAAALEAQIIRDAKAEQLATEAKAWDRTQQAAQGNTTGEAPVDWVTRINKAKNTSEVETLLAEMRQAQAAS